MARLIIRHETLYAYERPVTFAAHRLLVRPRDSHAIRVVDAVLTVSPGGDTRWQYDALGNSVCVFTPRGASAALSIASDLVIERFPAQLSDPKVADPQTMTPIVYPGADRATLAPFIEPATEDEDGVLLKWLREQVESPHEPALEFLLRLNPVSYTHLTLPTNREV